MITLFETIKQLGTAVILEYLVCLPGIVILSIWLMKTSMGKNALINSVPRQNSMPLYMPFIPLFVWFGATALAITATAKLLQDLPQWQQALFYTSITCIAAIAATAVIIMLVRTYFTERIKGFGLDFKTIKKDLPAAALNLLAAWPLVLMMLAVTILLGRLLYGQDFQLQQHDELQSIVSNSQLSLRILIVVTSILIVPAFEEMLFRGLFQTIIRSFVVNPWIAIAISSALFAITHANIEHWPALFMLSACMGYSYEKSGSLFRPIIIHSLFNAISIIATLYQ
ncbi:MAG: CPBP family intramembrane metalloprotease [Planctomycetes bacterium]|nr:CPBP family intramembrane metalloprotease [Planctomycetota bacterium]